MHALSRMARAAFCIVLTSSSFSYAASAPDATTSDGGSYYGPLAGGKLHGNGRLEWPNGTRYRGAFARGVFHGHGQLRSASGETYEGAFSNGMFNGNGRLTSPGGAYRGEFKDNFFSGRGEMLYSDGRKYRGHELVLNQNNMRLRGLPATELAAMLKETGIRWKVVVVSACYSGGFVDPLKDEHTLVITAARHDRRSFGCADENDFTYFGRAYFEQALPASTSFREAFGKAEVLIRERETAELKGAPESELSLPQITGSNAIDEHVRQWWNQAPR